MLTATILGLLLAQESETALPFERIARPGRSSRGPDCQQVIRDAKAWKAFWELYNASILPAPPPPPKVDFAAEAVVAAIDKRRMSGGYTLEILKIVRARDEVRVHVRRTEPPAGRGQTSGVEEPGMLVRVRLPDGLPVRFVEDKP